MKNLRYIFWVPILLMGVFFNSDAMAASSSVVSGAKLFTTETFGGNGITCASCHIPSKGYTIAPEDVDVNNDVLFIPSGREVDALTKEFALFAIEPLSDGTPARVRSVNHIFGLAGSHGWGGNKTLTDIIQGAIKQHGSETLSRVENVDFRPGTTQEVTDLTNFMTYISGSKFKPSITSAKFIDAAANNGKATFTNINTGKCQRCHTNTTAIDLIGVNGNRDTGVEANLRTTVIASTGEIPPPDEGDGTVAGISKFNFPPVVAGTGPYFHNNALDTIRQVVAFYSSNSFNRSEAAGFTGPINLTAPQQNDLVMFVIENTAVTMINGTKSLVATDIPSRDGATGVWIDSAIGGATVALRALQEENIIASAQTSLSSAITRLESLDPLAPSSTVLASITSDLDAALGQIVTSTTGGGGRPPRPRR